MRPVRIVNKYSVASCAKIWLSTQISDAIRDGAEGFFRTQYGSISRMAGVLAFIILGIYMFRKSTPEQDAAGLEK